MSKTENRNPDTITDLLRGARSFREREYGKAESLMPGLAAGQKPRAMVIACADSRVDPALIFDARPGDLLVLRVVGNLVPPPNAADPGSAVMSAVEVGLQLLEIPHLVICGHSHCAGVRSALDATLNNPVPPAATLRKWTRMAEPACREVIAEHGRLPAEELSAHAEQRSILKSLENLRAHPWLREREASGRVTLHGWWFELATGDLWEADLDTGMFTVC